MSVVTNAILHCGSYGDEFLRRVNEFFSAGAGFVSVTSDRLPYKWYGGTKALECDLAIGAFNHLDLTGLIDHLRKVGGPFADELQLMVKEQEHNRFRMINIIDESAEAPV